MKLLYACADEAADPLHWSGTVSNCRNALQRAGATLEVFDRIPFECSWPLRILHQGYKRLAHKTHYLQVEPSVLRRAANRIVRQFKSSRCDAIFCPGTGVPVYGYIPQSYPVFTYLDATKHTWINSYFGIGSLSDRSRRQVEQVDLAGLVNNTTTIFSSDWALSAAARQYGLSSERLEVVPFGANLASVPTAEEVGRWVDDRQAQPMRILFLGKEWERKGGPQAVAVVRAIRSLGHAAILDVVGCTPSLSPSDSALCQFHGFVNHTTEGGSAQFNRLLRATHFMLFLSEAEAFGIALCEAAAFGVPSYASNVGGIPTVIKDQETGWLAPTPFSAQAAAETLVKTGSDFIRYRKMAMRARSDFEQRLNWDVAGRCLLRCVETGLGRRIPSEAS